jgi:hypothetical protein
MVVKCVKVRIAPRSVRASCMADSKARGSKRERNTLTLAETAGLQLRLSSMSAPKDSYPFR